MLWPLVLVVQVVADAAACTVGEPRACPVGQFCAADFEMTTKTCPAVGTCRPLPRDPAIDLALPVPAGARVYCTQGTLMPDSSTHSACSPDRRFALDLASSAFEAPNLVVAAADGIAHGWGDCPSTDLNHDPPDGSCNLGLGNVVRVQHPGGLFTEYAHLSAILITEGEAVKRGEPIGVEGNSGAAGSRHVHFSLHTGDASRLDPAPSLPMRRIRVRGGRLVDGLTLRCGDAAPDGGPAASIAYVSGTAIVRRAPRIGFSPPERYLLESAAGKIFDADTRPAAIRVLRSRADEPLAQYWLAVALELDGDRAAASVIFLGLARGEMGPAWMRRWSWLRMADIEATSGRWSEAERDLERALRDAPRYDADFLRFADWMRRVLARAKMVP